MYSSYQQQIAECDERMSTILKEESVKTGQQELAYLPEKKKPLCKNAPSFPIDKYIYQLSDGVDLLQIDGVSYNTILTLMSEVGLDLAKHFPSSKHFVSWMSLCPNKRITGGKVLSRRTKKNKNRLACAFRQAANTVGNQKDTALSGFFRRISHRKGRKVAIVATARKLAIIVYNMLVKLEEYQPQKLEQYKEKLRKQKIKYIQKTMSKLQITKEELATN